METRLVTSNKELLSLLPQLMRAEVLALDTETTGLSWQNDIVVGVSFSWDGKTGYYVPFAHTAGPQCAYPIVKYVMELVLRNPHLTKVFHHAKFDIHQLMTTFGVRTIHPYHDTMIMAFLSDNTIPKDLKLLSARFFGPELKDLETELKALKKSLRAPSYGHIPVEAMERYASGDAVYTWKLFNHFKSAVLEMPLYWTELELVDLVIDMERTGVQIDSDFLVKAGETLDARLPVVEKELTEVAGWSINPRSPTQVAKLLYDELGMRVLAFTDKGKPSTAEEVLLNLPEHPAIRLILEARTLSKVRSTYVVGILDKLDAFNRLHCRFNPLGAETGRFSSSKPNLQNIPREGSVPVSIRGAFVPSEGRSLFFIDYRQMEMRMLAHCSGDAGLLEATRSGFDFHLAAAAQVFHKPPERVSKAERKFAKTVGFGICYGIGITKLAQRLQVSRKEARRFLDSYHNQFPGVEVFTNRCKANFSRLGYVENMFGRHRKIPYDKAFRSVNTLIQGSAADLLKVVMVRLKPLLRTARTDLVLTIHDELGFDVPNDEFGIIPEIVRIMEDFKLRAPIEVDVEFTETSWAEKRPWTEPRTGPRTRP